MVGLGSSNFHAIDRGGGGAALLHAHLHAVVLLVPLLEGRSIHLDDGALDQGLGAHQLVVGRVVGDVQDAHLARHGLGAPGEVAVVETQSAELGVAAAHTHAPHAHVGGELGHGGLAPQLILPLLAPCLLLAARSAALVQRVTGDAHGCSNPPLKSVESLAGSVIRTKGKLGQLNSADARNLRSLLLSVNDEGDWRALAIRSAACLYRLEGLEAYRSLMSSTTTGGLHRVRCPTHEEARASQEALHIYAPLAARLGMFRLKTELEDAAFRTLYPHSHAMVSALCGGENTNSVGEGMKSVLSDITNQMKRLVHEDTSFMEHIEHVSITARVKEPYSIWRKMLKMSKTGHKTLRDISILDIPDAVALRVVFSARKLTPDEPNATTRRRENDLCYYTLDLCTRNWPEMADSRFKDYIKEPKENGYQSLHYSSRKRWRGSEWPFEVQIRTKEMHRVAEYGVAAHWHYKRSDIDGGFDKPKRLSSRTGLDKTSESYLKSRQEWKSKQPDAYRPISNPEYKEPAHYIEDEIRRVRKRERDERLKPYLEALSGAQTDMARENVFVFISVQAPAAEATLTNDASFKSPAEGTVISLPRGSRVLDAIRAAEKWSSVLKVGKQRSTEFVTLKNGQRTSFSATEQLINGDVVSILLSSELVSSKDKGTMTN